MLGFVMKIEIALKSGEKIYFSGSGCQEATVNFFKSRILVTLVISWALFYLI